MKQDRADGSSERREMESGRMGRCTDVRGRRGGVKEGERHLSEERGRKKWQIERQ